MTEFLDVQVLNGAFVTNLTHFPGDMFSLLLRESFVAQDGLEFGR